MNMGPHSKYLFPVLIMVGLLFIKDVGLVISSTDNPLYWMENVEENEQKTEKEKEEKKDSDEKKFTASIQSLISNNLSSAALHIVGDRKYRSPSFEVVSPPPEPA